MCFASTLALASPLFGNRPRGSFGIRLGSLPRVTLTFAMFSVVAGASFCLTTPSFSVALWA